MKKSSVTFFNIKSNTENCIICFNKKKKSYSNWSFSENTFKLSVFICVQMWRKLFLVLNKYKQN